MSCNHGNTNRVVRIGQRAYYVLQKRKYQPEVGISYMASILCHAKTKIPAGGTDKLQRAYSVLKPWEYKPMVWIGQPAYSILQPREYKPGGTDKLACIFCFATARIQAGQYGQVGVHILFSVLQPTESYQPRMLRIGQRAYNVLQPREYQPGGTGTYRVLI